MRVRIAIDRLVLDGLPLGPADSARLVARIEHALARELRANPAALPLAGHATDRILAPALTLPDGTDVQRLGDGIAAALRASIAGGDR